MTKAVNKDLIHLQNAHVTQLTDGNERTDWMVRKNITNEDLATLPKHFTEKEVFEVLDFARKYELIAWNEGIRFGKQKTKAVYDPLLEQMEKNLAIAREENERLATILEKHIGE